MPAIPAYGKRQCCPWGYWVRACTITMWPGHPWRMMWAKMHYSPFLQAYKFRFSCVQIFFPHPTSTITLVSYLLLFTHQLHSPTFCPIMNLIKKLNVGNLEGREKRGIKTSSPCFSVLVPNEMAPTKIGGEKKTRWSAINKVVTQKYTINNTEVNSIWIRSKILHPPETTKVNWLTVRYTQNATSKLIFNTVRPLTPFSVEVFYCNQTYS